MQGAGENCRYLFPEASPLGSDGLTSFLQPQSYGPWPACPIMGPESVYSPITGSAGDLHPAPSPALSPIMGLVSRTQVDKRQQRDLLALMGLVSHTQGDERQQKAPEVRVRHLVTRI